MNLDGCEARALPLKAVSVDLCQTQKLAGAHAFPRQEMRPAHTVFERAEHMLHRASPERHRDGLAVQALLDTFARKICVRP